MTSYSPRSIATAVAVGAALTAGAAYALALLQYDPVVWPDEALFANPAVNLLRHGHLGTDVMKGYFPGVETRTYWYPPLYFLVLAAAFAVAGVSIVAMRGLTLLTAVAALVTTWRIGRRLGLDHLSAAIPVALLAVDGVFLRAARLGRMDMLALALTLAAWERALAYDADARPRDATLAGLLAGLAAITHPLGLAAGTTLAVWWLGMRVFARAPLPWRAAVSFLVPVAAWGLYVLPDPSSFVTQFGSQVGRKAGRDPWSASFLWSSLRLNLDQYRDASNLTGVDPQHTAAVIWAVGTAGLVWATWRSRPARLLLLGQLVLGFVVLASMEMWYAVYLLPAIMLGVGVLLGTGMIRPSVAPVAHAVIAALCVWFATHSLMRQEALRARWFAAGDDASYARFSEQVGALLPAGATVFVSVLPDVYLGLARRTDLQFRSFLPSGHPIPNAIVRRTFAEADYVVTGPWAPGTIADGFGPRYGTLVGEVGRNAAGYRARVYRMPRADTTSTRR